MKDLITITTGQIANLAICAGINIKKEDLPDREELSTAITIGTHEHDFYAYYTEYPDEGHFKLTGGLAAYLKRDKPKCQWKPSSSNSAILCCNKDATFNLWAANNYKFCPYCGKEIEVTNA